MPRVAAKKAHDAAQAKAKFDAAFAARLHEADDFYADDTSTITVRYTDSQEPAPGTGNLSADPLFADSAANDYHEKSTAGRWDPAAQGGENNPAAGSVPPTPCGGTIPRR